MKSVRGELDGVRGQFKALDQPVQKEVADLVADAKRLRKELEQYKEQSLAADLDRFVAEARTIDTIRLATGRFEGVGMDTLLSLGERFRALLDNNFEPLEHELTKRPSSQTWARCMKRAFEFDQTSN